MVDAGTEVLAYPIADFQQPLANGQNIAIPGAERYYLAR
jgi:hypothetical protein